MAVAGAFALVVVGAGAAHPGVAGELTLSVGGSNPLGGNGFSFTGSFDLQVNTTRTLQSVMVNGSPVNIAAGPNNSPTPAVYVQVHAGGTMIFGTASNGFQLQNGNFYLAISTDGLTISASATMVIKAGGTQLLAISATGGMLRRKSVEPGVSALNAIVFFVSPVLNVTALGVSEPTEGSVELTCTVRGGAPGRHGLRQVAAGVARPVSPQ